MPDQTLSKLRHLAHAEVNPVLRAEYAQAYAAELEKAVIPKLGDASQPLQKGGTLNLPQTARELAAKTFKDVPPQELDAWAEKYSTLLDRDERLTTYRGMTYETGKADPEGLGVEAVGLAREMFIDLISADKHIPYEEVEDWSNELNSVVERADSLVTDSGKTFTKTKWTQGYFKPKG
jgi:hypothetical protein